MVKVINNKLHIQLEGTITKYNYIESLLGEMEGFYLMGASQLDCGFYDEYTDRVYVIVFFDDWGYQTQMDANLMAGKEVVIEGREPWDYEREYLREEYGWED